MDGKGIDIRVDRRVGRVVAVSASQVVALLESQTVDGGVRRGPALQLGTLVKIHTEASTVFGMVAGLRTPLPSAELSNQDLKTVELDLVGEKLHEEADGSSTFQRGVSIYPALDDLVYLASSGDLAEVYARPGTATAPIGTIHQDARIPAYILTNELLGKHFSVVGTTGSGKSCVVASILGSVIQQNPNAHIMLLDPHDEYSQAFPEESNVLRPRDGLYLPYWLFTFEEIVETVIGPNASPAQSKILAEAVLRAKAPHFAGNGRGSVDTPVPYRMSDVVGFLDTAIGSLERAESVATYQSLKSRLVALQSDPRYKFVFTEYMRQRDDLPAILGQLFRVPVSGKPITILDLSGIPSEVMNVVVSVLCRIAFDFALWSETSIPVTIICEEAHRYAPSDDELRFDAAKRALLRIAKEGRKYGVSLCVVSQRPSDLAPGLLSECNTIFALRMTNQEDQDIVCGALPEASHGLMNFLPALRNGEAIAVGEGVSMPMRIRFSRLPEDRRPKSATASFTIAWSKDYGSSSILETVERWRQGTRGLGS